METGDKEVHWKQRLRLAEVEPSDSVWEGISLELDKQEAGKLKNRIVFYKLLAAASVTIALLTVGFSYYSIQSFEHKSRELSGLKTTIPSVSNEQTTPGKMDLENVLPLENKASSSNVEKSNSLESVKQRSLFFLQMLDQGFDVLTATAIQLPNSLTGRISNPVTGFFMRGTEPVESTTVNLPLSPTETPIVSPLIQTAAISLPTDVSAERDEVSVNDSKSKKSVERFWTAIGIAAGTFNNTTPTNMSAPTNALRSTAAGSTAASQSNSPGYSYAVNIGVGAKLNDKWLLHGGLAYITQNSDYTATTVIKGPVYPTLAAASINEFESKVVREDAPNTILASTPYTVNSSIQIISFPVQTGYLVFERKVALQINSGISTDLFLQNTITPHADNLTKTTKGRGDDSPYRPVNFSGLLGTEFSYKFGENYRISLNPGLRYPFNSIYKTDLGVKSSPLTFDIALRFRYILK